MLFDTHAHLNDDRLYSQADQVVERARQAGVRGIVNVGYDLESSRRAVDLGRRFPECLAAVGMHPHDARHYSEEVERHLLDLVSSGPVAAWGEIGLDYHYDNSPREIQKEVFVRQLQQADRLKLPVIIHNRDSHGDMLEILRKHPPKNGGIMHCFSGSAEFARDCLKLDLHISFAGPVTFKNASRLLKAVETVPDNRILAETDCPYLSPEPFRGKTNEPSRVALVVEKLAEVRGVEQRAMEEILWKNAEAFFGNPHKT